jgi:hypothetical protein
MGKKAVTAQRPFTMLIAHIRGGSDPSRGPAGNPDVVRSTYRQQHVIDVPGRGARTYRVGEKGTTTRTGMLTTTAGAPVNSGGVVAITNPVFEGPTSLILGEFTLTTNVDFVVDPASAANTATALAAAIANLPGYAAAPAGANVNLQGPVGVQGNEIKFRSEGISAGNFTLTPAGGALTGAEPEIGPPTIT